MKLITELEDDVLFMKKAYELADIVKKGISETGILEIRKNQPDITGNETEEELQEKIRKQAGKNFMDMSKRLMVEKPEEAIKLFQAMIVLEDGEEYPQGFKLFGAATKCLMDKTIIDFFIQLIRLEREISNA